MRKVYETISSSYSTKLSSFWNSDCEAIYENGPRTDGMYMISPDGRCPFLVYCDMKNGGWTVIQVNSFLVLTCTKLVYKFQQNTIYTSIYWKS
jgi:hypothetical protein